VKFHRETAAEMRKYRTHELEMSALMAVFGLAGLGLAALGVRAWYEKRK